MTRTKQSFQNSMTNNVSRLKLHNEQGVQIFDQNAIICSKLSYKMYFLKVS